MNIFQRRDYTSVIKEIRDSYIYIFGHTRIANVFYLYCKEKEIESKISAFIISNMEKDRRKIHEMHGIPIVDIESVEDNADPINIFMALKEDVCKEQIFPLFQGKNVNLYYVNDAENDAMYDYYMQISLKNIMKGCTLNKNIYEAGYFDLCEIESNQRYKYYPKVANGVTSDINIFGDGISIDGLYKKQFGKYDYIQIDERGYDINYKCAIYLAKSHVDKELKEEFETPFIKRIQVGAALTDIEIEELKDNCGDNISSRNRDYCEMSAVYWAWKNDNVNDYIGLCHYRRRFVVNEKMMSYIVGCGYDAVLTVPKLTDGGMREEFVERFYFLTPEMWHLTESSIASIAPDYLETWKEFEKSFFLVPCNMFIMSRACLNEYCSWLFPILREIDNFYLLKGIVNNNRYLGYISECLLNVFFMKNKDRLKKGFVEMKLLESK